MKIAKEILLRNWFWIVVALILTYVNVKMAFLERGYEAYGGELLTMPVILLIVKIIRNLCNVVMNLFKAKID